MFAHVTSRITSGSRLFICYRSILLFCLAVGTHAIHPELLGGAPTPPSSESCTAHAPVTNECVEAGLRARREGIRAEAAFREETAATHLQLAERLNQQGNPNGAIEDYRAAIELDPDLVDAFLGLGAVYLDQHEWKLAEEALERAAHLDRENSQIEYWLGRSLLAQQKFSEARDALKRATRLEPDDAEAFSDLGLTYMAQGQSKNAIKTLRQAIRLRPDFSEAHSRLELAEAPTFNEDQLIQETAYMLHLLYRKE